jgi:hypothetical protein
MNPTNTPVPAPAGNFIAMLQQKTGGVALVELEEALAALVERVQSTRKKGKLTYTLTIKPNAKNGVRLVDDIKLDRPKEEAAECYFYVGAGGALLRNDPNQLTIELRSVPSDDAKPLRAVNQ